MEAFGETAFILSLQLVNIDGKDNLFTHTFTAKALLEYSGSNKYPGKFMEKLSYFPVVLRLKTPRSIQMTSMWDPTTHNAERERHMATLENQSKSHSCMFTQPI